MNLLSEYLYSLRLKSDLDQRTFAKAIGTNQAIVSKIENGKYDLKIPTSKIIDCLASYTGQSPIKIMEKFVSIEPHPSRKELFDNSPFSSYKSFQELFISFAARLEYLRVGTQTLPTDLYSCLNFLSWEIIAKYKTRTTDSTIASFFTTGMSIVAHQYVQFEEIREKSSLSKDDFETWFLRWDKRKDFYNIVINKMFSDSILHGNKRSTIIIFVFNENNRIEREAFEYLSEILDVSNLPPYYYSLFLYRDGSVKSAAIKEYNEFKNVIYNF